jgi:hypothetical protein
MSTVNERLQDQAVSHAVDIQRYSNGVVRRIIALLNRADPDIATALQVALDRLPQSEFTVARLDMLLHSVRELNRRAYDAAGLELTTELRKLVEYEAGYQAQLFETTIPAQVRVSVGVASVNVEQVYAAALARPFQGRLLKEWAAGLEADKMARIRDAVRMGFVQQEPIADIVKRIRGTKAKGYSDGIMEIDRRNIETIVRTAISHTAGAVRDDFLGGNADLVKAIAWTATLDSRTSQICSLRDHLEYTPDDAHKPIGHKLPWLSGPGRAHFNCRSTGLPVTKSWQELGIDAEQLTPSERASMDGTVPASLTYGDWLKRQSAQRQDFVLGPTRAALMRKGGLTLDKFANDKGKWLTLDELRIKDAAAFERAGL